MTLDELKLMWEKDAPIPDDLGAAALQQPMLHSKYIGFVIDAKLRATKSKYFRGEMTREELTDRGWQQWQYKTLKTDIEGLIEADSDYQKLVARESYLKSTIYFLESVLGAIKDRGWATKAGIDWAKFRAGV
jgi:Recombination, repair and ssDNA binding protein UvsY